MGGHPPQALELQEVLRITTTAATVAAIIDSERQSADAPLERKREEFRELCKKEQVRCLVLERRATENYFPDVVVKSVFGDTFRGLGPYEILKDAQPHWPKNQNWKLAAAMSLADLKTTDLGKFLNEP
jgi:hypothetical protein